MTYLAEARAGDWGHEFVEQMCVCGVSHLDVDWRAGRTCPAKIARFTREKVREALIAEIEALAKERCAGCEAGRALEPVTVIRYPSRGIETFKAHVLYREGTRLDWSECDAQPEQRRLAALRAELQALEEPAPK